MFRLGDSGAGGTLDSRRQSGLFCAAFEPRSEYPERGPETQIRTGYADTVGGMS